MNKPSISFDQLRDARTMNKPEHIEFYETRKPEEPDTRIDTLDNFAKIEHRWSTPFMEMESQLPEKMRRDLIEVLIKKETAMTDLKKTEPQFYSMAEAKGFYATTHYNLFAEKDLEEFPEYRDSILGYEQIALKQIRYYIRKGWGVQQADDMVIEGRCFGNVQEPGARTYPHYHQDINGVLVNYLQVGDENRNLDEQLARDSYNSPRHGSHNVLFLDPRPAISYPYWEKVYAVTPKVGLTIIHPSNLWHETNQWLGDGIRVVIVVNFRILSHGYNELLETFRG